MSLGGEDTTEDRLPAVPDVAPVPLWGPPSGGRTIALWDQAPPTTGEERTTKPADDPPALGPPTADRRHRAPAIIGAAVAAAVLLLGVVAVTGWPGTGGSDSLANGLGSDGPRPTGADGRPMELPPSQPATPVSFAPGGEVVRPDPSRARIVDPDSGEDVMVALPPGSTVDTSTGQVVVRVTGTATTVRSTTTRPATTTTRPTTTSTTEESTTSTTEDTTTTTEETTTTVESPPTTPDETLP